MLKLYYSPNSPFARKVRVVLHEKGLPFEIDELNQLRDPDEFRSINPILKVPVLEDGAVRLFESDLIIDYLLTTYPGNGATTALPLADTVARSGREGWEDKATMAVLGTLGDTAGNLFILEKWEGLARSDVSYLERQATRIQACLDWLEERATLEGFIPGSFAIQDIALICLWEWIGTRGVAPLDGRPTLRNLVELHALRQSLAETRPAPFNPG